MEKYVHILKGKGLKITPQRLTILKYLDENRTHPDADIIYNDLKSMNPSLSRTTVYNTLDALRNIKIIQELTISKTETRYDYHTDPHHHFLCMKCGSIIDVDIKCPHQDSKEVDGHRIEEIHGYFKGICKICSNE
jgi:Fe2+ or Zn2+ uptake regulation protein